MFIDSHCHLNFPCFDLQRKALLMALKEEQINELITLISPALICNVKLY